MHPAEVIRAEWDRCFEALCQGEFFRRLSARTLTLDHYKAFLREEYHNTTENPKIMAVFYSRLDTRDHSVAAKLLKHAAMETGHNEMALDDLAVLGEDTEAVRRSRALPATEALAAFVMFEMEHRNPLAFLGYLYHMEALSERLAGGSSDLFAKMGVPAEALGFLKEHAEADLVHAKWNREYLETFIRTEGDLPAVLYGIRGSALLHGLMFQGILDSVSGQGIFHPREWSAAPAGKVQG